MQNKPTYKDLEQKIKDLEQDAVMQKQTEVTLKASELRLTQTQKIARLGSWKWDIKSNTQTWSDELYYLLGYVPHSVTASAESILKRIHPDDLEFVSKLTNEFINGSKVDEVFEHRIVHPDGTERYVQSRWLLINDNENKPIQWIGTILDITERKQAVGSLRESEEKYRALIENSSDLILILDKNGINVWNSPSVRQYGIEPEDAIGRPFDEYIHPDDLEAFRKCWKKIIANPGKKFIEEHRAYGTPGNPDSWVYQHNSMVYLPNVPGINGVVAVCRDVTDIKQVEQALRNEKNFIDMAIDSLPGIFYLFTKEGKFIRWNQNFETISGYTAAEISTMSPLDFFPVEEQALVEERISEVFSDGESFVEANWLSKDGTKTLHYLTGVLVNIEGTLCQVGMGVDISGRKRAEEEREKLQAKLQQAQKIEAIGTLAGGIAHDFNNMLGVITGNLSNALCNLNKNDELYEVLFDILESSKQAQTLTQQLLTFSKGGAPIKKVLDINKLIKNQRYFRQEGQRQTVILNYQKTYGRLTLMKGRLIRL